LAAAYRNACEEVGCHFFDAGSVVSSSQADGVHLDAEQHSVLGAKLSEVVRALLADSPR
jgi:hypothetical protein